MLCGARKVGYRNHVHPVQSLEPMVLPTNHRQWHEPIRLELIAEPKGRRLFKSYIGAYHYLGYQQPAGEQLQYLASYEERPIACLSFGPGAYKIAPRDQYVGWSAAQRQERLAWVINNDRFLILPSLKAPNLASYLLSRCTRRLRRDWRRIYQHDVALLETFVEVGRFSGCSYAAANWIGVGASQGRGRNDRHHQNALPSKAIWLYPLQKHFRRILCAPL
jgi:hypothetical protein